LEIGQALIGKTPGTFSKKRL